MEIPSSLTHIKYRNMSTSRFTSRLSQTEDYKRDMLIQKIEHAIENMSLGELEAVSYDLFTKGYIESL